MLPDWIQVAGVQWVLVAGVAGLLVVALLTVKLARKAGKFLILTVLAVGLAIALATQWVALQDCQDTCSCRVFGQEISIPEDSLGALCGENRVRVSVDIDRG